MRPNIVGGSLLILGLALGGCADNAYYQSRAMPTSSEESFGFGERLFWHGDSEAYELPAKPPAREGNEDELHRSRVDCRQPGQHFQPQPIVAIADPVTHNIQGGYPRSVGGYDDRPQISTGDTTRKPTPLVGWTEVQEPGARDRLPGNAVAGYDDRQVSQRPSGLDRSPATRISAIGTDDGWCPPKKP